ncbi:MAG TPA: hypothetical protein VMZ90_12590 [Vicinamibacterales bacterium]|nr:hypothetical protein [Vicinamibacterales bacterium]
MNRTTLAQSIDNAAACNDVMFGRWTIALISGGDIRRESQAINTVQQASGVDIRNRVEMYVEDSSVGPPTSSALTSPRHAR